MINELRITARHSPIYHTDSRGSTFATPARTAFKTVISGIDYKKEEKKENTEIIKAKLKGKIEQLTETLYLIFDYPYKYYTFKHFEV